MDSIRTLRIDRLSNRYTLIHENERLLALVATDGHTDLSTWGLDLPEGKFLHYKMIVKNYILIRTFKQLKLNYILEF